MRITAVIALCISLLGGRAVMAQTVAPVGVTPATVPVGQGTPVIVTAVITDPAVLAAGVQVQRYDSQGRVVGVLGLLNDDGANGDELAGDKTFSGRLTVYELAPGTFTMRVSAAFQGRILRVLSAPLTLTATGTASTIGITSPTNLDYRNVSPILVTGTVGDPGAQVRINGIDATVGGTTYTAQVPILEGTNTLTAVATNTNGTVTTASVQVTLDTTPPKIGINGAGDGEHDERSEHRSERDRQRHRGRDGQSAAGHGDGQRSGGAGLESELRPIGGAAGDGPEHDSGAGDGPVGEQRDGVGRGDAGAGQWVGGAGVGEHSNGPDGHGPAAAAGGPPDERSRPARGQCAGGVPGGGEQRGPRQRQRDVGVAGGHDERAGAGVGDVPAGDAIGRRQQRGRGDGDGLRGRGGVHPFGDRNGGATHRGGYGQRADWRGGPGVGAAVRRDRDRRGIQSHRRRAGDASRVKQGGGSFNGPTTVTTTSDSDGRVAAVLTLGRQEGQDNNVVEATFAGNPGQPAAFLASAKVPADPSQTRITGVVLDNANKPIPGVTMRLFRTHQNTGVPEPVASPVADGRQRTVRRSSRRRSGRSS